MRVYSDGGTLPLNTRDSVPRLTPLNSACTISSSAPALASGACRISPHPGAVTQNESERSDMVEDGSRLLLKSALRSILAAMVLGVALAWQIDALIGLGGSLVVRTLVLLCIGALFVVWPLRAHHPFDRVGIANQITMMRGVLALLLLSSVGMGQTPQLQIAALSIAMISSALDAADGWAARRTRMSSTYGARFDMETDALLILTLACWRGSSTRPARGCLPRVSCAMPSSSPHYSSPGCNARCLPAIDAKPSRSFKWFLW